MTHALEPGTYLVGRHDGSVRERFVKVRRDAGVLCYSADAMQEIEDAIGSDDWWWRPMDLPGHCPDSFAQWGPFPNRRGGLKPPPMDGV